MKYKVLRMVKRRAGESREDFARRWLAEHPKKAVVTLATGEIALGGAEAPFDGMSATYFATDDANDVASKVPAHGGQVILAPMDVMDQGRMAVFTDPMTVLGPTAMMVSGGV